MRHGEGVLSRPPICRYRHCRFQTVLGRGVYLVKTWLRINDERAFASSGAQAGDLETE
jgi:hypothetical protein